MCNAYFYRSGWGSCSTIEASIKTQTKKERMGNNPIKTNLLDLNEILHTGSVFEWSCVPVCVRACVWTEMERDTENITSPT